MRYDAWAIAELRRLKLVWQSWGQMPRLAIEGYSTLPRPDWGVRQVRFSDPARMRLFFLSLLWRAAATSLAEFSEIEIKPSDLRRLKRHVRDGTLPPKQFFPSTLTQMSTIGTMHNHAPIAQTKSSFSALGVTTDDEPIFRFYFDGLVTHFYRSPSVATMDGIEPMLVGNEIGTTLSTVTYEASWQLMNLRHTIADAEHEFPGGIARAEGR